MNCICETDPSISPGIDLYIRELFSNSLLKRLVLESIEQVRHRHTRYRCKYMKLKSY